MKAEQRVMADAESLIDAATVQFIASARAAIAKRGCVSCGASGVVLRQKACIQKLATAPYSEQIDWSRVHLFFGDERCVPATHDDSNYKMATQAMIEHIAIPS